MKKWYTILFAFILTACSSGMSDSKTFFSKESKYTINIDGVFEKSYGLIQDINVTIYECNNLGAVIHENKCTFEEDGSQEFVAHAEAKIIKVFEEMNYYDLTVVASKMYKKQAGWLQMSYALNPDQNTVVTINEDTYISKNQPD